MDFSQLIDNLKQSIGLESLTADNEGVYRILVNDTYVVAIAASPDTSDFFLYTTICFVPAEMKVKQKLFERFLASNLFGSKTHNAYFAFDTRQDAILLIRRISASCEDLESFMKELQEYVNTLVYWQKELEGLFSQATAPDAPKATGNLLLNLERMV